MTDKKRIFQNIKDGFIEIVSIPVKLIWIIFLVIILSSLPKDFYKKYDEHIEDMS